MCRITIAALALALPFAAMAEDTNVPGRLIVQSTDAAPTCSTAASAGELCVEGDAEVKTNLAVAGTSTLTGAITLTGAVAAGSTVSIANDLTMSADIDMGGNELYGVLTYFPDKTADYTVDGDDCGTTITTNDDNRVITLPAVATANTGCRVTFVNTAAADASLISISPNANDGIFGGCCSVNDAATTVCVAFSGTDDKDLQNTKAEQNKGDHVTLISDGSTGWYVLGCFGSWASES